MTRSGLPKAVVATVVLLLIGSAPAAAANPAPAWKSFAVSQPTNFTPGAEPEETAAPTSFPQYYLALLNVGGADTTEPVEVVDTLPPGIVPSVTSPPAWRVNGLNTGEPPVEEPCVVSGLSPITVTCTVTAQVVVGRQIEIHIPVNVNVLPSPTLPVVEDLFSVSGGGAEPLSGSINTVVSSDAATFGFLSGLSGLSGGAVTESGTGATIAGSHPYSVLLSAGFPTRRKPAKEELLAAGSVRNLDFTLPPGLVVNPQASTAHCTEVQLLAAELDPEHACPPASQVGTVHVSFANLSGGTIIGNALYDMEPPPGIPAELGFNLAGTIVHAMGGVDGEFHVTSSNTDILAKVAIGGVFAELWGNPADGRHDRARVGVKCATGCSVEPMRTAFLTMPSRCSSAGELTFGASTNSWEDPSLEDREAVFGGANSEPGAVEGCESLQFAPTMNVQASSRAADAPTGLSVHLHLPQNESIGSRATATLKKVEVQLPEGMTVNSAAADGLDACSVGQIGLHESQPASCPDASKVGTAAIETPLIAGPLTGSVYLAEPRKNPFGSLLALYLVVEGEGVRLKLPGRVDTDPNTGRVVATFDNNPQLPFNDLTVNFNGGARATLTSPSACGTYVVRSELTSWASPRPVVVKSPISIESGCNTGGFNPGLNAGTNNPVAGRYSPFVLRVTRSDGEQNLSGITTTLPEGLLAKLGGVSLCPEANTTSGSCPAASQIGTTTTGVGAGARPVFIPQPGKTPTAVYLAGPYKGAPYSLVIKVPAQAGPFDLGTIAVRAALNIDLYNAQVTAVSDPLPQILEGIPVAYRDVRVNIDRESFVLNPTSCDPMKVESRLVSDKGAIATPSDRFQVGSCEGLGFQPGLKLQLKGSTKRSGHPALKAVVTYPKKGAYANIAQAQVGLPHSEFLDQGNLDKVCTRPDLQAGTCPSRSIYGHVKAWTPLLDKPLEGPVYLGVGFGYKLPALVADLNGQVRILLKGKVDTTKEHGIRNTFEAVPDAPVSRFVLQLKGGPKYGLLENSENLCSRPQRAGVRFVAQNGKVEQLTPTIANSCKGTGKRGKRGA